MDIAVYGHLFCICVPINQQQTHANLSNYSLNGLCKEWTEFVIQWRKDMSEATDQEDKGYKLIEFEIGKRRRDPLAAEAGFVGICVEYLLLLGGGGTARQRKLRLRA